MIEEHAVAASDLEESNLKVKRIDVATDYSAYPGPRYESLGPHSGEDFRDSVLVDAFGEYDKVIVCLDGTKTCGSSFLDEAFGGLVRNGHIKREMLLKKLEIVANEEPELKDEIIGYIEESEEG